jgi:hypothetical protein
MKNFRTYDLAVELYKRCQKIRVPKTVIRLLGDKEAIRMADRLGASLYRLIQNPGGSS